ncbi:hypothetical protein M8C13_02695 [Crossiella sp. SN42]|uniref:hypothetical protein n=1 Tax=Crossiella sp. SN42 TaxID=2944808 RepID=UPI00207D589E|nr:hypothetical protein [Crossiella sp. SN42]MCO1574664.1 hypothetical protein [Crossiella sp. SN42]
MTYRLLRRVVALAAAGVLTLTGIAAGAEPPAAQRSAAARPATVDTPSALVGPNRTVGVLYILRPNGSVQSTCTAATVSSATRSLIVTAAHCLAPGGTGAYYHSFEFLPGFSPDQPRPFGTFKSIRPSVAPAWLHNRDYAFDVGFLSVQRNEFGQRLGDAVGENGFQPNQPVSAPRTVWGYQDGFVQQSCFGQTYSYDATRIAINCRYDLGASGGPWLRDYNATSQLGLVNGVNSQSGSGFATSSYFGDAIWNLYQERANGS